MGSVKANVMEGLFPYSMSTDHAEIR